MSTSEQFQGKEIQPESITTKPDSLGAKVLAHPDALESIKAMTRVDSSVAQPMEIAQAGDKSFLKNADAAWRAIKDNTPWHSNALEKANAINAVAPQEQLSSSQADQLIQKIRDAWGGYSLTPYVMGDNMNCRLATVC